MKYIFILALFAAAVLFAYWRLRPYIRGVRRLLGVLREVNRVREGAPQPEVPRRQRPKGAAQERLLRCAACGTWMPASRAVSLRGGASYCSHACLERAADLSQKSRKSAS